MNLLEMLSLLIGHLRGMWRYRWYVIGVAWFIAVVGWTVVYLMPNTYQASSRVYVDTDNALKPLLRDMAVQADIMNEVTLVTRAMLSRPSLEKVARETDLDLRVETPQQFEMLLASLQKRITVQGGRDNVFTISYEDPDRNKAEAVVKTLLNSFVEDSLRGDKSDSTTAQRFLEQQIREYESRLTQAESALAEFKRQNVGVMPDQRGDYYARLQTAMAERDATRSQLRLALERKDELNRQLEGEEPVFGIMPSNSLPADGPASSVDGRIRQLEAELSELRLQYTDKYPRIQQILSTIETLEARKAEEISARGPTEDKPLRTVDPLDLNPVYQNMKIQLSSAEVEVASLRAELNQQESEVSELRGLVDKIPQVEAELQRLNRDYDVVKQNYEALLSKLESAVLSEKADESTDDVQFRIIEPPFAPLQPTGPKRLLFLTGVLILALGMGIGYAFVLNQLNPVYNERKSVLDDTGIPVLGSISLILSQHQKAMRRADKLALASAGSMLLVAFASVMILAERASHWLRSLSSGLSS